MSIEIKNYNEILYTNPFHVIPARYIKSDLRLGKPSKSFEIKDHLTEVKKLLVEKKTESDNKIAADTWTIDFTKEGEEKRNKALVEVIAYFDKKIGI